MKDSLSSFEIQQLMSAFNQAETLSSNIQKTRDTTASGIIDKLRG